MVPEKGVFLDLDLPKGRRVPQRGPKDPKGLPKGVPRHPKGTQTATQGLSSFDVLCIGSQGGDISVWLSLKRLGEPLRLGGGWGPESFLRLGLQNFA